METFISLLSALYALYLLIAWLMGVGKWLKEQRRARALKKRNNYGDYSR